MFDFNIDLKKLNTAYEEAAAGSRQVMTSQIQLLYTTLITIILAELAFVGVVDFGDEGTWFGVWAASLLILATCIIVIEMFLQALDAMRAAKYYNSLRKGLNEYILANRKLNVKLKKIPDNLVANSERDLRPNWLIGKLYWVSFSLMLIASGLIIAREVATL